MIRTKAFVGVFVWQGSTKHPRFVDIFTDDSSNDASYVDLTLNPEAFTGYKGDSAARIWKAIYTENCFKWVLVENSKRALIASVACLCTLLHIALFNDFVLQKYLPFNIVQVVRVVRKWGRGAKSPPTIVTGAPYFFTIKYILCNILIKK